MSDSTTPSGSGSPPSDPQGSAAAAPLAEQPAIDWAAVLQLGIAGVLKSIEQSFATHKAGVVAMSVRSTVVKRADGSVAIECPTCCAQHVIIAGDK